MSRSGRMPVGLVKKLESKVEAVMGHPAPFSDEAWWCCLVVLLLEVRPGKVHRKRFGWSGI